MNGTSSLRLVIVVAVSLLLATITSGCDRQPVSPSEPTNAVTSTPGAPASLLDVPFVFYTGRDNRDELMIVDREGAEPRVLAKAASRSDWSRDGRIAYDSRRGGAKGIFVIAPDGGAERRVGPGEDPSWSPDGRSIVTTDGRDLYVLDVDGGAPPRLVASPPPGFAFNLHPAWSPDGATIAFSACTSVLTQFDFGFSCQSIYTVRADGSQPPAPLGAVAGAHAPAWSAEGRLAFSAQLTVFVMDTPASAARPMGRGDYPAWTSDGRLVYQVSDGSGWRLVINDHGVERRLVPDVASSVRYSDEHISVRR